MYAFSLTLEFDYATSLRCDLFLSFNNATPTVSGWYSRTKQRAAKAARAKPSKIRCLRWWQFENNPLLNVTTYCVPDSLRYDGPLRSQNLVIRGEAQAFLERVFASSAPVWAKVGL